MRQLEIDATVAALSGNQEEFVNDQEDKRMHRTIRIGIVAAALTVITLFGGIELNAYRNSFKPACPDGQALYYVPNGHGVTACINVNVRTGG